jgi:hypothetical protein
MRTRPKPRIDATVRQNTTGSQPLVSPEGDVHITGVSNIADAIEDALLDAPAPPQVPQPPVLPKRSTPGTPARGGVGIGLPYTGPQGEPIFGLTPEQRLAQVGIADLNDRSQIANALEPETDASLMMRTRQVVKSAVSRKKWLIYGGIAAAAIIAGVVIAVVTAHRGNQQPEQVTDVIDPDSPAGRALAEYKHGNFDAAMTILQASKDQLDKDGDMQLVLGHVHAAKFERGPSIAAYAKALNLRPDLAAEPELRNNLKIAAGDKDPQIVAAAFDLWMRTGDPEAQRLLLLAAVSDAMPRRHAVREVIERAKLTEKVDWLTAYVLDLQDEANCLDRKKAVAKLRALGDPRAVSALEEALFRPAKTAAKVNINKCLVDDAKAAIAALKQRKPQ